MYVNIGFLANTNFIRSESLNTSLNHDTVLTHTQPTGIGYMSSHPVCQHFISRVQPQHLVCHLRTDISVYSEYTIHKKTLMMQEKEQFCLKEFSTNSVQM